MTYIRADLSVNPHDSELMLNRILKHLIRAEDKGMLAMEFFDHDPKAHAKKKLKRYPMKPLRTFLSIYIIILYFNRHVLLLKGFIGFLLEEIVTTCIYILSQ